MLNLHSPTGDSRIVDSSETSDFSFQVAAIIKIRIQLLKELNRCIRPNTNNHYSVQL